MPLVYIDKHKIINCRKSILQLSIVILIGLCLLFRFGTGVLNATECNDQLIERNLSHLLRHVIQINPCIWLTDPINATNQSIEGRNLSNGQTNYALKCESSEQISLISFERLHKRCHGFGLEANLDPSSRTHYDNTISTKPTINPISKGDNLLNNSANLSTQHSIDEVEISHSCRELNILEQIYLSDMISRCNNRNHCMLGRHQLRIGSQRLQTTCRILDQLNIKPIIQVTFTCTPKQSGFLTRKFHYSDISNKISCPPARLIYLRRSALVHKPANLSTNESKLNSDWFQMEDDQQDDEEFGSDKNYNSQYPQPDTSLQLAEIATYARPIALGIFEKCHGQTSCSVTLARVLDQFQNLDSLYKLNLHLELDYVCISKHRFVNCSDGSMVQPPGQSLNLAVSCQTKDKNIVQIFNANDLNLTPKFIAGSIIVDYNSSTGQFGRTVDNQKYPSRDILIAFSVGITVVVVVSILLFVSISRLR